MAYSLFLTENLGQDRLPTLVLDHRMKGRMQLRNKSRI